MATSTSSRAVLSKVFALGTHLTQSTSTDSAVTYGVAVPPKPLMIFSPSEAGVFPVLIFLHGFLLYNSFYSELLHHIASHGFIVVAPQLYSIAGPDATEEVKITADIAKWLSKGLIHFLPKNVQSNIAKLALSGHSRGGKVSFALALSKLSSSYPNFSAIIGVDPVDGMGQGRQTPPPVLTYTPQSFSLNGMPVLIIGSGLGEAKSNPLFPPCAPKGVNHQDFFDECSKPAYHFVAKDYGHLDMLNDDTRGLRGHLTYCLCKNGDARGPMRRFVGGIIVAFLKAVLCDDSSDLVAIRQDQAATPVFLERIEFRV